MVSWALAAVPSTRTLQQPNDCGATQLSKQRNSRALAVPCCPLRNAFARVGRMRSQSDWVLQAPGSTTEHEQTRSIGEHTTVVFWLAVRSHLCKGLLFVCCYHVVVMLQNIEYVKSSCIVMGAGVNTRLQVSSHSHIPCQRRSYAAAKTPYDLLTRVSRRHLTPASPSSITLNKFSIFRCSNVNRGYKNGLRSKRLSSGVYDSRYSPGVMVVILCRLMA